MTNDSKTYQRDRVLDVMRETPGSRWLTHDLSTATGYGPGFLYSVLAGLERSGEVSSSWLPGPVPRRRCYVAHGVEWTVQS